MKNEIRKILDKTDSQLWAYGEWLERFINGNPRYSDFLEMGNSALKILEINYEITDSDPVFHFIRKIDESTPENENIFSKWDEFICSVPIVEQHQTTFGIFTAFPGDKEKSLLYLSPAVSVELLSLGARASSIRNLLKKLKENENPWEIAILDLIDNEKDFSQQMGLKNLLSDFEGITSALKSSKGRIRKIKNFSPCPEDARPMFRWSTVTARMLFGFLSCGGQKHYSFCEHCGKFTLVQRKGRKRFCSDICRVYDHQQREGTKAKILHPIRYVRRSAKR